MIADSAVTDNVQPGPTAATASVAEPSNGSNGAPANNGPPPPPEDVRLFLTTLFEPKDQVLLRPIETWTEGNRKASRVVFKKIQYRPPKDYLHPHIWARNLKIAERENANLFFGACPRFKGNAYDRAWQIRIVRALWCDIDQCTPEEALERCKAAGHPRPTILVRSGHGVHLYWLLAEPYLIDDVDAPLPEKKEFVEQGQGEKKKVRHYVEVNGQRIYEYLPDPKTGGDSKTKNPEYPDELSPKAQHAQHILAGVAAKIGGDHTQDLSRLLRLPCTLNRKDQRNGKEPVPCELVECDPSRRYPLADFEKFAEASPARAKARELAKIRLPTGTKLTRGRLKKLNDFVNRCAVAPVTERSESDFALCCWAIKEGIDKEEVWPQVEGVGKFAERGRKYFDLTWGKADGKVRQNIHDQHSRKVDIHTAPNTNGTVLHGNGAAATPRDMNAGVDGVHPPDSAEMSSDPHTTSAAEPPLPSIQGNDQQLRVVTDAALQALLARNDPPKVFHRGGVLTRLRMKEETAAPYLETLAENSLRGILARVADWFSVRHTKNGDEIDPDYPPMGVVKDIMGLPTWEGIPLIESVAESPFFDRAGRLVVTPGFHREARVWFHLADGLEIPPVSPCPSPEEIDQAKNLLLGELLGDFPFVDDASKANALAALLLPFVRRLIDGPTPMHLFDAPVEGTGKTLLVTVITMVATGREPETLSEDSREEDWRKRITAMLLEAPTFILLDNLNRILDSSALASVLTAQTWKDRVLGYSKTATLPNTAVWMASGNNTRLSRELIRRTLLIRIDSKMDAPWERTNFRHPNLTKWVRDNRGQLVGAALTLCQAWIAAGRPPGRQTLGMFEGWVEAMGGILDVAGVPGLLTNAKDFRSAATDKVSEWRAFVTSWWQEFGTKAVGIAELFDLVVREKLLDSVLGDKKERSQRTRLGIHLGKARDRVFEGFRITSGGMDHKGRQQYLLDVVQGFDRPSEGQKEVKEWSA